MTPVLEKVDRAACLRIHAMAAVRALDFERAQRLRAEAERLDNMDAVRRQLDGLEEAALGIVEAVR